VLPDLSDLVQKIEWANANPAEARLIQRRGWEVRSRFSVFFFSQGALGVAFGWLVIFHRPFFGCT
jgi:hypothetical protein